MASCTSVVQWPVPFGLWRAQARATSVAGSPSGSPQPAPLPPPPLLCCPAGGEDRRGFDEASGKRPASVKASLSVAMGQRAPNRANVREQGRGLGADLQLGRQQQQQRRRSASPSYEDRRGGGSRQEEDKRPADRERDGERGRDSHRQEDSRERRREEYKGREDR